MEGKLHYNRGVRETTSRQMRKGMIGLAVFCAVGGVCRAQQVLPTTFLLHPEYNHDGVIKGFTPIYLPDFSANKSAKKPAHKHK